MFVYILAEFVTWGNFRERLKFQSLSKSPIL